MSEVLGAPKPLTEFDDQCPQCGNKDCHDSHVRLFQIDDGRGGAGVRVLRCSRCHWTKQICGARLRSGKPCTQVLRKGRNRCRVHGGSSPRGADHPSFKTGTAGRFSAALPPKMRERYEALCRDPELLCMQHEVSLLDLRIQDILSGMQNGSSPELWEIVIETFRAVRASKDADEMNERLLEHEKALYHGHAEKLAWDSYVKAVGDKARLAKQEWGRLRDMKQLATVEQVMTLVASVVGCVKKHETNPVILDAISRDVARVLDVESEVYGGPGQRAGVNDEPLPARLPAADANDTRQEYRRERQASRKAAAEAARGPAAGDQAGGGGDQGPSAGE